MIKKQKKIKITVDSLATEKFEPENKNIIAIIGSYIIYENNKNIYVYDNMDEINLSQIPIKPLITLPFTVKKLKEQNEDVYNEINNKYNLNENEQYFLVILPIDTNEKKYFVFKNRMFVLQFIDIYLQVKSLM